MGTLKPDLHSRLSSQTKMGNTTISLEEGISDSKGPSVVEIEVSLERLGRERPSVFKSALAEVLFCLSLLSSLAMASFFVSGFHTLLPALALEMKMPPSSYTWPSSVLTLVVGAFILPIGRLADMYGGYLVFNSGFLWFGIWSLVAGFSRDYTMLIACRAMQGIGAAAFLPASIMLMGRAYRPGPRKNFIFSLYGAASPISFFLGILAGGLAAEKTNWRWYFWFGSLGCFLGSGVGLVAMPRDYGPKGDASAEVGDEVPPKMDFWGLFTISPGLVLVIFAITQSSMASKGWATPFIYVSAAAGVLLLAAGVYVERYVSDAPFLPPEIFQAKNMTSMLFCLVVTYGIFGIFLFYSNFYFELVLHLSPLTTALYFTPWAVLGLILALTSGLIMHLLSGRVLLIFCGLANLTAVLIMAMLPAGRAPNYWAYILPAMLAETACADVVYTVSNVFITTRLPRRHQGLAGSLINLTLYLGVCLFLGGADIVVGRSRHAGLTLEEAYNRVFWAAVGASGLALAIFCCMDVEKADSRRKDDETQNRQG